MKEEYPLPELKKELTEIIKTIRDMDKVQKQEIIAAIEVLHNSEKKK